MALGIFALDTMRSTVGAIVERPLGTGVTVTEDGLILKRVASASGGTAAGVSTGDAGDDILGMAQVEKPSAYRRPIVSEESSIPAGSPYTVTLLHSNLVADSTLVLNQSGGATISPASINTTTGVITFDIGDAGKDIYITYTYYPTMAEVHILFGEGFAFRTTQDILQQVPVVCGNCEIFTLVYETAVAYTLSGQLYVTSGGRFTSASGTKEFGKVTQVPSASDPFLGVSYFTQF